MKRLVGYRSGLTAGTANPSIRGFESHPDLHFVDTIDFGCCLGHTRFVSRDQRGGHNRKKINEDFFKEWSSEMAYVLGFMFADGSLIDSNQSSRTYYLAFSNTDYKLLEKIRSALDSNHRIYVRPAHIMKHKKKKYACKEGYVLRIGNKNMYSDLISLGMSSRKSRSMKFPDIPDEYFYVFLRGYFDGDGCINTYLKSGRNYYILSLIFTSASECFLAELSAKLAHLLKKCNKNYYNSMGAYNLIYRGKDALLILEKIYENIDSAPYMFRKYDKYLDYVNNLVGPRLQLWLDRRDLDKQGSLVGA